MKTEPASDLAQLEVRRIIPASPGEVFAAWTDPGELLKWWGPHGVRCVSAEVDLRIGGRYRIGNELPDKSIVWIEGIYEQVEIPALLVYTWSTNSQSVTTERVSVQFKASGDGTEIIVRHELIESESLRDRHLDGWQGCLDGLADHLLAVNVIPR